jgi:hypothetical protein
MVEVTLEEAGLLTPGSFYFLRLPLRLEAESGRGGEFVPGYSGGTVPDFNGIPY